MIFLGRQCAADHRQKRHTDGLITALLAVQTGKYYKGGFPLLILHRGSKLLSCLLALGMNLGHHKTDFSYSSYLSYWQALFREF